jgi:hypothetical protein
MNSRTTRCFLLVIASCLIVGCGNPQPPAADPQPAPDSPAVAPSGPAAVAPPARAAGTAAIREITFDDIKLELQKGEPFTRDRLTPRVTDLERQRVRIRGYILPSFQQSGLTQFVLVRDNQECCFGPGAALHDCVVVRMQPGQTADFSIRPVAVEGRFRVEELRGPDGRHLAIYALDGERVQ